LEGKYKENDELKEVAIGKQMGVSRTPVREALRQLELEGLVKIIPNKGAYVIGISNKDLKDIYEMRSRLEGLCARWATKNATKENIEELEENVDLTEFQLSKKKYDKVLELDNEFHNILYDMADSKMLYRTLSDFHHYLEIIRKKTLSSDERVANSIREHRNIVKAIKYGNKDSAEQLAILHIKNTIKNIEEHNLL
jgi:DNA-binding GntR family transcriptional regulator